MKQCNKLAPHTHDLFTGLLSSFRKGTSSNTRSTVYCYVKWPIWYFAYDHNEITAPGNPASARSSESFRLST